MTATEAAVIRLGVPILTAVGVVALGEPMTWRLLGTSLEMMGGITTVISMRR